jgi:spore coat protein U-like protein
MQINSSGRGKALPAAVLLLSTGLFCASAGAQTVTADLQVRMQITGGCAIENVAPVDFGTQALLTQEFLATGSFDVRCTNGLPYDVTLSDGLNPVGDTRRMAAGGEFIAYELYSNPGRTIVWGDDTGEIVEGTGNGAAQPFTVYGEVPPQTTPTAGLYTDTVTITVIY